MHALRLTFLFSSLLLCQSVFAKVCVLVFEREKSAITSVVKKSLEGKSGIEIKVLATPMDILRCVKERAEEILIVSHALETPASVANKSPVNLAYFTQLSPLERAEDIESSVSVLDEELAAITKSGKTDDVTKARVKKLTTARRKYLEFPADHDYVRIYPILPNIFKLARAELARQYYSGQGVALKKIRLMSCVPEQVLAQYKDLTAIIQEQDIDLDIAPKNKFMSLLEKKTVTSPNPAWLKKSLVQGH